jgi:predicted nucleic acid-binding protein
MPTPVDSNIPLRSLHREHPHYALAHNAIAALRLHRETLCIAPQNLIEFWAVATRSRDDNGLGMAHARAAAELEALRRFFQVLPYSERVGGVAADGAGSGDHRQADP